MSIGMIIYLAGCVLFSVLYIIAKKKKWVKVGTTEEVFVSFVMLASWIAFLFLVGEIMSNKSFRDETKDS